MHTQEQTPELSQEQSLVKSVAMLRSQQEQTAGEKLPDSALTKDLRRLECSHSVRNTMPRQQIEYNACEHDYTLCNNQLCIKKLV